MNVTVHHGDCLDVLRGMGEASVDACCTDPPYGFGFMGRCWDHGVPGVPFWVEVLRVMKPGAHLVAFGGTRTYHRMVCAIEDAGFEIRDQLAWLYGSGFPKSHDIGKAIDRAAGAEREAIGSRPIAYPDSPSGYTSVSANSSSGRGEIWGSSDGGLAKGRPITAPATVEAAAWQGWGTALKPAHEPIVLARKPLACPTVAAQVLATGTGALNVDGCRVGMDDADRERLEEWHGKYAGRDYAHNEVLGRFAEKQIRPPHAAGRWPANLVHDGSPEVLAAFAEQSARMGMHSAGHDGYQGKRGRYNASSCEVASGETTLFRYGDTGTAARFFYSAKASKADRAGSKHPTVKPLALTRWLCRLVTPPGGIVLDPFAGSGTTGEAAMLEGFSAVLIELEAEHVADIRRRLDRARGADTPLLSEAAA